VQHLGGVCNTWNVVVCNTFVGWWDGMGKTIKPGCRLWSWDHFVAESANTVRSQRVHHQQGYDLHQQGCIIIVIIISKVMICISNALS
jgi:hypothetical protein